MTKLVYVGPHDGVDVPILATGRVITVERDATAEIPDAVADSLLEQGPEHWQTARTHARRGTPAGEAAPADAGKGEGDRSSWGKREKKKGGES